MIGYATIDHQCKRYIYESNPKIIYISQLYA
jgi:hypothetical protein